MTTGRSSPVVPAKAENRERSDILAPKQLDLMQSTNALNKTNFCADSTTAKAALNG